jgi:hypothetical protein
MKRPGLCIVFVLLLTATVGAVVAHADGLPVLGVDVGGVGVVASSGNARYVTLPAGRNTVLARVKPAGGQIAASRLLRRRFTIPAVAYDGSAGGLSADGRTLTVIVPREGFPRVQTELMAIDTRQLRPRRLVRLRGDFSFDAISPHGSLLYLIEYVLPSDPTRYVVRAYDLRSGRLLARPVIDPREPGEKMRGSPLTRATSADGRWAYTLYDGAGKTLFIHALDTSTRSARCIDLDTLAGADRSELRLQLNKAGNTLIVGRNQQRLALVDTSTFQVHTPTAAAAPERDTSRIPWTLVALASAGVLVAAAGSAFGLLRRHRRGLVAMQ